MKKDSVTPRRLDADVIPFNNLSPAEAERLALLMEEAGEIVQIAGKILRHGYEEYNPNDVNQTRNRNLLERELGDMQAAMRIMLRAADISEAEIKYFEQFKLERVNKYLHHNKV